VITSAHRERLTERMLLRFSPQQRAAWQQAADRDGRSLSDFIRRAADAAARQAREEQGE
jgi:uncharacterized protein (DUF1778 family)